MSLRKTKRSAAIHRLLRHNVPRNDAAKESGNVIVWILVAVALMAGLSYAFMGSSRTSGSFLTDTQAEAYASEIIAYGNEVKGAVKRLMLRGCSDTEISFENNVVSGYTNPNSPTDNSCHVFDLNGGGLQLINGPAPFANTGANFYDGKYAFINATQWTGNGTDCADASCVDNIMLFSWLNEDVCDKINSSLGYTGTPQDTAYGGNQFTGSYIYAANTLSDEAGGTETQGKKSACFFRTVDSTYIYTQVLIAR